MQVSDSVDLGLDYVMVFIQDHLFICYVLNGGVGKYSFQSTEKHTLRVMAPWITPRVGSRVSAATLAKIFAEAASVISQLKAVVAHLASSRTRTSSQALSVFRASPHSVGRVVLDVPPLSLLL